VKASVQHGYHDLPWPGFEAAVHHQEITVVDPGSRHRVSADPQKEGAAGMANQDLIEVNPDIDVVVSRTGEAGGDRVAGQGQQQRTAPAP